MFGLKHSSKALKKAQDVDLSKELPPTHFATISDLSLHGEICTMAYDPFQSLLAVGTKSGMICLFGNPAVSISWQPRLCYAIKFVAFKSGTPYLCVVDVKDSLMIYDLSQLSPQAQEPTRIVVTSLRGTSTCIHAPAAHSHILIGFKDGSVDAFDVLAGKMSPYRIPNLWIAQEELMRRSGLIDAPRKGHVPACMDIKTHPRDINLLLIAYEGGVVLWNIRDKAPQAHYDMTLPPGATGGGTETSDDIFTERRPAVICTAWRPDGLLFAVGHEDGSIAFWDPQDVDRPVQVRTIDRPDVNVMNPEGLFGMGTDSTDQPSGDQVRQPIFALAWSGFPEEGLMDKMKSSANYYMGASTSSIPQHEIPAVDEQVSLGTTILTVLGGLLPRDALGVHCLVLPPFHATMDVKRSLRQSLRDSVQPNGRMYYPSQTEPQDFLLLAQSVHYNSTFDPSAIIILQAPDPLALYNRTQTEQSLSNLKAYQFNWVANSAALHLGLPTLLELLGHAQILSAKFYTCSNTAYQDLISIKATHAFPYLDLHGGEAKTRLATEVQKTNRQAVAKRVLVTCHADLTLHFWDASPTLLDSRQSGSDMPLLKAFPEHLFLLNVRKLLNHHPSMLAAKTFRQTPDLLTISAFDVALDSGETVIALSSGEAVVFRLSVSEREPTEDIAHEVAIEPEPVPQNIPHASEQLRAPERSSRRLNFKRSSKRQSNTPDGNNSRTMQHDSLLFEDLSHVPFASRGLFTFLPSCSIQRLTSSNIVQFSLSSAGFLAISWSDGAISAIDLRGPDEMLHVRLGERWKLLTWTACALPNDPSHRPRLLATGENGTTLTFTFEYSLSNWICTNPAEPPSFQHTSSSNPIYSAMLDVWGNVLEPTGAFLQDSLVRPAEEISALTNDLDTFFIVVAHHSTSIYANLLGERLAKVEFVSEAKGASVVQRYSQSALLVAFTDSSFALYSIPHLAEIQRHKPLPSEPPTEKLSLFTDGEFLDLSQRFGLRTKSIWSGDRAVHPPFTDLWQDKAQESIPASMSVQSWVSWLGGKSMTSDQFDSLLAGSTRQLKFPRIPVKQVPELAQPSVRTASPKRPARAISIARTQRELNEGRSAASETRDALEERSQKLDFLNDTMEDISKGASDLVASAKKLALQQSAKNSISAMFR